MGPKPRFPKRVYTTREVERAKKLVESGYKHRLTIKGSPNFKQQVREALGHIKTAGYYNFLRTYIRRIVEIDGFSQLRETEAAIWLNLELLKTPIQASGFIVQKTMQMQEFLEGKLYYGGAAEARSVDKRIEFLKTLKQKSKSLEIREECDRLLKQWEESTFIF